MWRFTRDKTKGKKANPGDEKLIDLTEESDDEDSGDDNPNADVEENDDNEDDDFPGFV